MLLETSIMQLVQWHRDRFDLRRGERPIILVTRHRVEASTGTVQFRFVLGLGLGIRDEVF
jgi:hypothetical protein